MAAKKKMDAQKTVSTKKASTKSSANKPKPVTPPEPPSWIRDKYSGHSYLGPTGAPIPRSAPSSNAGNSLSAIVARFIYGAGGPKTMGR